MIGPVRFRESLLRMLLRRQTWVLEVFLAVQAAAWGLWVAMPTHATFAELGSKEPTLLGSLPEWFIGTVALVHGVGYGWALHRKRVDLARRAALATMAGWAFVLTTFLVSAPLVPIIPIYLVNVGAAAWVYVRLYVRFSR